MRNPYKITLLALALLCLLTACGAPAATDTPDTQTPPASDTETQPQQPTLAAIQSANRTGALLESHQLVQLNAIYYDETGAVLRSEAWQLGSNSGRQILLYEDSNGYSNWFEGDRHYIFQPEDNSFTVLCLLPEQAEAKRSALENLVFRAKTGETVVSWDEATRQLTSEVSCADDTGAAARYGLPDCERYQVCYTLEKDSAVLRQFTVSALLADGTTQKCVDFYLSFREEELAELEFVTSLKQDTDTRNCTLIRDPGTSSELSRSFAVSRQANFSFLLPDGYAAYLDEAGTIPAEHYPSESADITIYLLPTSEDAAAHSEA